MGHTILVTGANRGIGFEAVKLLSQRKPQATILLGARTVQNGNDALVQMKFQVQDHEFSNVTVLPLDITSSSSLQSAFTHIKSTYSTLDALIQNAGISNVDGDDKHPAIFDANITGAQNTIETFQPILTPEIGTIIQVSSTVASWYMTEAGPNLRAKMDDIPNITWEKVEGWMKDWDIFASGGKAEEEWVSMEKPMISSKYCASKTILNPWIRRYAADHPELRFAIVCPGLCQTALVYWQGTRSAEDGANSVIWPLFNEFENGKMYQDGVEKSFVSF
jgi:NAD(P)-dependent dehydrogenase (short-subunit alcohol dehydrogenase family)